MRDGTSLDVIAARTSAELLGDPDTMVWDVVHDSREAGPGVLFVAIRGFTHDGHDFVSDAAERSASALCVEERQEIGIPQLVVQDMRTALAQAAAQVHGDPSEKLLVVGITGTNGKTTVTHMLEAIAERAGRPVGVIGTLGARIAGRPFTTARTTPEATDLQRLLRQMTAAGIEIVAMEVSSHALALHRTDEVLFEVAAFTNLSQDHLDFHADMEHYFAAKRRLFSSPGLRGAVVWIEDPYGVQLHNGLSVPAIRVVRGPEADVWAGDPVERVSNSRFVLHVPSGSAEVELPLGGGFNLDNSLVAAGCAHLLGFTTAEIADGLGHLAVLPGRFEHIVHRPFSVIVDYAHTPEGIRTVVEAARSLTDSRVIVVVGAGGDRDRAKRPEMGQAAAAADVVVVTSDNPRSEKPDDIVADVAAGMVNTAESPVTEPDRRLAIRYAIEHAAAGDIVLVLGKGHEQGQDFGDRVVPFDDREVVREEMAAT